MKTIKQKLENFDLDFLDTFEEIQYNSFIKNMTKAEALQILINNVEGDFYQLSDELREIAEEQSEMNESHEMENLIIEKAIEIIKSDFMQYPDYDESIPFTFLDAITAILAQTIEDVNTCEIYDFLQSKFKN